MIWCLVVIAICVLCLQVAPSILIIHVSLALVIVRARWVVGGHLFDRYLPACSGRVANDTRCAL